jgi:hypothetical protein
MNQVALSPDVQSKRITLWRFARMFEWCVAGLLTVSWVVFHVRFFLHAGGLWRDEVNSVDLCNSTRISDIVNNLQYDSFPLLWHLILRVWIRSGIGSTDQGIRLLGLLTGLAILATVWSNARRFRLPTPIAMLTLLGFTSAVLCYGDSIRAYGLGILTALLTLGFMWDVVTRPSAPRVALALVAALASVQILFYNSVILFAICCGAAAVALRHRKFKRVLLIGSIGLVCTVSMAPYHVLLARSAGYRNTLLHEPSLSWLISKFVEAVGYDSMNPIIRNTYNDRMWAAAIFAALVLGILALFGVGGNRSASPAPGDPPNFAGSGDFRMDALTYHLTVLLVGVVGYWAFLFSLSYVMHPWYYLALLALVAACVDGLLSSAQAPVVRIFICLGAIYFCAVTAEPDWYNAGLRKTNIDLICNRLSRIENRGDLVLISPFFYGITFQRYDRGPAKFVAVPGIDFLAYCKLDLLNKSIQDPGAMTPILGEMAETLRSGHAVYLVGDYFKPNYDQTPPPTVGTAPNPVLEWNAGPLFNWPEEIADLAGHHAKSTRELDVPLQGISGYERPGVRVVTGWVDGH